MTLLFVRHAIALRRQDWSRDDDARPLSPRGEQQADALPDLLAPFPVDRILSSPSTRCVDTVQPLAARRGLPVESMTELAEGSGTKALARLEELSGTVVVCSHGDVIPELVLALLPSLPPGGFECQKGSTWVLGDAGAAARYLPPPA